MAISLEDDLNKNTNFARCAALGPFAVSILMKNTFLKFR